jgi:hypothetical protein
VFEGLPETLKSGYLKNRIKILITNRIEVSFGPRAKKHKKRVSRLMDTPLQKVIILLSRMK